jgi:hypothetical protein
MAKARAATNESPRERFLRLAPPRVDAALKKIGLIGNLSRNGYEYELAEVKQMINALEDAVEDVKQKFSRKKETNKKAGFAFTTAAKRSAA